MNLRDASQHHFVAREYKTPLKNPRIRRKDAHIIGSCWFPALEWFASVVHAAEIPKLAVVIVRARDDPRARRVKSESGDDLRVILED